MGNSLRTAANPATLSPIMKISKATFILITFLLTQISFASDSMVRYEYVSVVKSMLVEKAIKVSESPDHTAFDYIKTITKQAISNIRHAEIPMELSECVTQMKADLEQRNIYMTHQEIVETIIAAVNS